MAESQTQPINIDLADLPLARVDARSPVPLYHQIYLDLKNLIQTGALPPGALLPAELDLCRAYGVGRQTMRMAISGLVDDNLVERFAGRGTFVRSTAERMKFYLDRSFTQQIKELGYEPDSQVLEAAPCKLEPGCPAGLRAYAGAACLRLRRLRLGDGEPIALQTTLILTERCPDLARHDFSRASLYEVLGRKYQLFISEIQHVVRAVAAEGEVAERLHVAPGEPLLAVDTTAYLEDGQVIECTTSFYRGDKYEYSTRDVCCE